jgi:hypothetical protein
MKKFNEFNEIILRSWSIQESLFKLNFAPEQLSVFYVEETHEVAIEVQQFDKKTYIIVGKTNIDFPTFNIEWDEFSGVLKESSDEELTNVWEYYIGNTGANVQILMHLIMTGFEPQWSLDRKKLN